MKREDILNQYKKEKEVIEERLREFEQLRNASDQRLFKELVFVILTSQSSAKKSWEATEKLEEQNLLMHGDRSNIAEVLESYDIQYEENKASYIVENRENLSQPTLENPTKELKIKDKIDPKDLESSREWLVENVKGLSWKGSSHFLRNIGYGNSFAIISKNISRILTKLDLIESASPPTDEEQYLNQEGKLQRIAEETGIDIKALDLVLWSIETGEVFK